MDDWLKYAISYIIKSLIEAGYSIEDKLYLLRIGEEEETVRVVIFPHYIHPMYITHMSMEYMTLFIALVK